MKKTIRIKFKQKLHSLYLDGVDERPYRGEETEEAILEDIFNLQAKTIKDICGRLRMEKGIVKKGMRDKDWHWAMGYNRACDDNNKKIDEIEGEVNE